MKIESIQKTKDIIDVYDFEVEDYHNALLSSGVFAHNCELRNLYAPRNTDYLTIHYDYSANEIRTLAYMSQDENLLAAFASGEDVHKSIAAIVWNILIDEVTDAQRRFSKMCSFCLHPDTKVPLVDGRVLTIKELEELYSPTGEMPLGQDSFSIYSITPDGDIVEGLAYAPRKTKLVDEIYEVELDDGTIIKTDETHPFILRDSQTCSAKDLRTGDSLMPFYRKTQEGIYNTGKELLYNPKLNNWSQTHRKFVDQNLYSSGNIVHHVNQNYRDNRKSNLTILDSQSTHMKLHIKNDWKTSWAGIGFKNQILQYLRDLMEFNLCNEEDYNNYRPHSRFCRWENLAQTCHISLHELLKEAKLLSFSNKKPIKYEYNDTVKKHGDQWMNWLWTSKDPKAEAFRKQHSPKQSKLITELNNTKAFQIAGRKQKILNFLSKMISCYNINSINESNYNTLRWTMTGLTHKSKLTTVLKYFISLQDALKEASFLEYDQKIELRKIPKFNKVQLEALSKIKAIVNIIGEDNLTNSNYNIIIKKCSPKPNRHSVICKWFTNLPSAIEVSKLEGVPFCTVAIDLTKEELDKLIVYPEFEDGDKYTNQMDCLFFIRQMIEVFGINNINRDTFKVLRYRMGKDSKGIRPDTYENNFGSIQQASEFSLTIPFKFDFSQLRKSNCNKLYSRGESRALIYLNSVDSVLDYKDLPLEVTVDSNSYHKPNIEFIIERFISLEKAYKEAKEFVNVKIKNHKIIDIRIVKLDKPLQLYNLTVDKYHNFAIVGKNSNSGVIIKQSIIYGKGLQGLADDFFSGDLTAALNLLKTFFTRFPRVETFIDKCHKDVLKNGYVTTLLGDRIYIDTKHVGQAQRYAVNYPIQSSSSSFAAWGIWKLTERCWDLGVKAFPVNFTHDSGDWEVYAPHLFTFITNMKEIAVTKVEETFGVPVAIDWEMGICQNHTLEMKQLNDDDLTAWKFEGNTHYLKDTFDRLGRFFQVDYTIDSYEDKYESLMELFITKRAYSQYLGTTQQVAHGQVTIKQKEAS